MTEPAVTKYRVESEQALLGLLLGASGRAENCGVMPSDLCPELGHPEILSAIVSVHEQVGMAEPSLVLDRLIKLNQHTRIGQGAERGAVYLHTLIQSAGAGSLAHHVKIIRGATARRSLWTIGSRLAQTASEQTDLDVVLDVASDLFAQMGLVVDTPLDNDTAIPNLSLITDFVAEPSPPHNWVIPGILERQDRVMLVAGEGVGKSWLARQVVTLLAAGRHPFAANQRITPRRTLLIDLENPIDMVRRHLRGMVTQIHAEGLDTEDRAWRWNLPSGIDLRSQTGYQLMVRAIEQTRPDLVAIGPLYKASHQRANDTHETAAADLARAIDRLRERYGCAFWIEHHQPKGDGVHNRRTDPIGSSFWLRWPEFGVVLRHDDSPVEERGGEPDPNAYLLDRFRGDRDRRTWPDRLHKNRGPWAWMPEWHDPEVQNQLYEAVDEDRAEVIREDRENGRGPWIDPDVSNGVVQTVNAGVASDADNGIDAMAPEDYLGTEADDQQEFEIDWSAYTSADEPPF